MKNNLGKNLGDDFKVGKITLPVILAWQEEPKYLFLGKEHLVKNK